MIEGTAAQVHSSHSLSHWVCIQTLIDVFYGTKKKKKTLRCAAEFMSRLFQLQTPGSDLGSRLSEMERSHANKEKSAAGGAGPQSKGGFDGILGTKYSN